PTKKSSAKGMLKKATEVLTDALSTVAGGAAAGAVAGAMVAGKKLADGASVGKKGNASLDPRGKTAAKASSKGAKNTHK
ncbi:MAG TPA: hypothetical protein VL325_05510, partial [Pyrinomonadaceae bacterium]|nr:hypothetical protein [Pyrinomonadaceae bacterium]